MNALPTTGRDVTLVSVEADLPLQQLADALGALGVAARIGADAGCEGSLVAVFTAVTPALVELVQTASDGGRVLVLAAGWGPAASLRGATGWRLLDAGAADVLVGDEVAALAAALAARARRWWEVERRIDGANLGARCVGSGRAWRAMMRAVVEGALQKVAPVLLGGESGTGKEVVARLLHDLDGDAPKALVTVDCTTIARELSGSELFGHVRGAFTGAHSDREGAFALADGGTLFLDEIGDLPLPLQAELLRVVQEGTFKAVGSNVWRRTAFRLVAATHRDLRREVADGRFRHDLYHRLAGWRIELPPLRERLEDLPLLVDFFLREIAAKLNVRPPVVCPEVLEFLAAQDYPGNVRQLRNVVQRAVLRQPGMTHVTLGAVAPEDRPALAERDALRWLDDLGAATDRALACGVTLKELAHHVRECAVRLAVRREGGSLQRAAKLLGVTDRALQIRSATKRNGTPADAD